MIGGSTNEAKVTVDPPMRFRISWKFGIAKPIKTSIATMDDLKAQRFQPKARTLRNYVS